LGSADYPLPNVETTLPSLRETYNTWIQTCLSNYSIDGLRIDSVKNVEIEFWAGFQTSAGIYTVGEVSDGRVDYACPYRDSLNGILKFPQYFQLIYFFNGTQPTSTNLVNLIQAVNTSCKDPTSWHPSAKTTTSRALPIKGTTDPSQKMLPPSLYSLTASNNLFRSRAKPSWSKRPLQPRSHLAARLHEQPTLYAHQIAQSRPQASYLQIRLLRHGHTASHLRT